VLTARYTAGWEKRVSDTSRLRGREVGIAMDIKRWEIGQGLTYQHAFREANIDAAVLAPLTGPI
jgi:hypothetical protein